tara:strand:- start:2453 stop:2812 length:360 start_codon:yes stop_codon:yes gene_type:complete
MAEQNNATDFIQSSNKAREYEKKKNHIIDLKLKKETIDMPIEVEHYGWFCDDRTFGEQYKPYRDWIEKVKNVKWDDYESGMLDNDTSIMQDFCDQNNYSIDCHYDEQSNGIYLIKQQEK